MHPLAWRRIASPLLSVVVALAAPVEVAAARAAAVMQTEDARFTGRWVTSKRGAQVARFSGIRYAEAERWGRPEVLVPEGEVNAQAFPPICPQGVGNTRWYEQVAAAFGSAASVVPELPEQAEQCLFLNIWAPSPAARRLPVIVWLHGGSNKNGYSFEPNYHGQNLAAAGAVVVSIAYRLGVFGFLPHPQLDGAGNFGLLDQIAALRWIAANIEAFGGDPENVTIMGESAGAADVGYLQAAPAAARLFHRAISQSGGWNVQRTTTREQAAPQAVAFAQTVGDGLAGLRALPAQELLAQAAAFYESHYWDPVIDGDVLPGTLPALLEDGRANAVPLLVGFNTDESLMYLPRPVTAAQWHERLHTTSEPLQIRELLAGFELEQKANRLGTAQTYACASQQWAAANSAAGQATYFYEFTQRRAGEHGLGAYHGAEIPYVFDTHDNWLPTSDDDKRLSAQLLQYWVNFARAGNPNGPGLPRWQAYSEDRQAPHRLGNPVGAKQPTEALCRYL